MGARPARLSPFRVALRLGRVSNLPTVWTNVLAGSVLGGGLPGGAALFALLAAATLLYVGGMFLNDAFDRHADALMRPERPIPSGEVPAAAVFAAGSGMLGAALLLLTPLGTAPVLAGLALAATIVLYDVAHKGNPLAPLVMGLCRALLYVTAALAVAAIPPAALWLGAAFLGAYVAGLTLVARGEARRPGLRRAVGPLIAGIALFDGLVMLIAGWPAGAALGVAGFVLTLALQRRIAGT